MTTKTPKPRLVWPHALPQVHAHYRTAIINGLRAIGRVPTKSTLRIISRPDCFCVQGAMCDIIDPKAWNGRRWKSKLSPIAAHITATTPLADILSPHTIKNNTPSVAELLTLMLSVNDESLPPFAEQADFFEANTLPY